MRADPPALRCLVTMSAAFCVLFDSREWTGHWACNVSVQPSHAAGSQVSFDHPMLLSDDSIVHVLKKLGDTLYTHRMGLASTCSN